MQIKFIELKDAKVPLLMTGYENMMDDFLKTYHFKIVEEENITNTANPALNKKVIKAMISQKELSLIINQS
jgi:CO dehydrogenase/acetyl-CoA synthase epsilon subunit